MNEVRIDGKITKKGVTVKYTPGGLAVADFSISRSRKKKGTDDWETEFFNVRAFDKLAESIAAVSGKVLVEGWLQQRRWQKDGAERSMVLIVANAVTPDGPKQETTPPPEDEIPF